MTTEDDVDKFSCIVASLRVNRFVSLSYEEQCRVIAKGRPKPDMKNLITERRETTGKHMYTRHFNPREYDKYPWLTGSDSLNKLFCWPCLLFRPFDQKSAWSNVGFSNLGTLNNALLKHDLSQNHIQSSVSILMFLKSQRNLRLEGQNQLDASNHNEGVARNREILRRLINAICYLARTGLSFRDHYEGEASASHGQYAEYLTLTAISELDPLLANHLALSTAFQSSSNQIQNDLIHALGTVMLNQIKQEVSEARYVSIILDLTFDTVNLSWLTTVLRYVNNDGVAFERFVGYTDLSSNKTAVKALFDHVIQVIEEFSIQDKLLAQAYDGAVATVVDLHSLMQEKYPKAFYMHSRAHGLNSVLEKVCARNIKECNLFFTILSGIPTFFLNHPKRKNAFDVFMAENLTSTLPSSWDLSVRVVNVIAEFLPQIIQFFEHMLDNPDHWDEETLIRAQGYIYFLRNFANVFLIVTFKTLFSHTEKLDNVMQTEHFDPVPCLQNLLAVKERIESGRNRFDGMWEAAQRKWAECQNVTQATRRTSHVLCSSDSQKQLFVAIIDQFSTHLSDQMIMLEKCQFFDLMNPKKFLAGYPRCTDALFKFLSKSFPNQFNLPRLKNECLVMAESELEEIRNQSPNEIVESMRMHKLDGSLPEIYKLLSLYLTLPNTPGPESTDWPFSAFKRIKACARPSQGAQRQPNLAFLSIEKNLLCQMKDQPGFYSKVINEYTTQEHLVEFTFQ